MHLHFPFFKAAGNASLRATFLATATVLAFTLISPAPVAAEVAEEKAVATYQQPFLWTATSPDGEKAFLFGTIHSADPRIVNLPDSILGPLGEADGLLVELILEPEDEAALAAKMMDPANPPLSERLPEELHTKLEAELKRINPVFTPSAFDPMHTWAMALLLPLIEDDLKFMGQTILDDKLVELAEEQEMQVHALETVDEQLAALTWMNEDEGVLYLEAVLIGMAEAREKHEGISQIEFMKRIYLKGDDETMLEIFDWSADLEGYDALHEKFIEMLITRRNHTMVERFKEHLAKDPEKVWFLAAGLLHFIGDDGIVDILEKEGWKIERAEG